MKKQEVVTRLHTLIKRFNQLDKVTQKENKSVLRYLRDLKAAAVLGKIEYKSVWHPMKLYRLKGDTPQTSVAEYKERYGDSVELVEGFHPIEVLKGNAFVEL
jgi:hypothetical protein